MQLRQLQCFVAAGESENFTTASESLHMSQSALSRQIANLEAEFGVPLFERNGHRVVLSAAGRRLKPLAEQLLKASQALKDEARTQMNGGPSGTVTLAAAPSQAGLLFPRLARNVAQDYPQIKLHFIEASTGEAELMIRQNEVDMALITSSEEEADIVLWPLFSESLYIYHPRPLAAELGADCSLKEALSLPLIVPDRERERAFIENLATRCGVSLNVVQQSNQHYLAISLTQMTDGALLLPASSLAGVNSSKLKPVTRIRDLSQSTALVRPGGRPVSPESTAVEQSLRRDVTVLQAKGILH